MPKPSYPFSARRWRSHWRELLLWCLGVFLVGVGACLLFAVFLMAWIAWME